MTPCEKEIESLSTQIIKLQQWLNEANAQVSHGKEKIKKLTAALKASTQHILDDGKCDACRLYNEAMKALEEKP